MAPFLHQISKLVYSIVEHVICSFLLCGLTSLPNSLSLFTLMKLTSSPLLFLEHEHISLPRHLMCHSHCLDAFLLDSYLAPSAESAFQIFVQLSLLHQDVPNPVYCKLSIPAYLKPPAVFVFFCCFICPMIFNHLLIF